LTRNDFPKTDLPVPGDRSKLLTEWRLPRATALTLFGIALMAQGLSFALDVPALGEDMSQLLSVWATIVGSCLFGAGILTPFRKAWLGALCGLLLMALIMGIIGGSALN
jgi:hypothetical protein